MNENIIRIKLPKKIWYKNIELLAIILAFISLLFSFYTFNKQSELDKEFLELTPSKYAEIEIRPSQFTNSIPFYSLGELTKNDEYGEGTRIGMNILNIGEMDSGRIRIRVLQNSHFSFEELEIMNIPAGQNNVSWMRFGFHNTTDVFKIHNLTIMITCPNCDNPTNALFKEINICVYNKTLNECFN